MSQNIWTLTGPMLQRQRRRGQFISRSLKVLGSTSLLDIGCAEGFTTSYMAAKGRRVVGLELDMTNLRIAKKKVEGVSFVNASIVNLPFRPEVFDSVCILEVLEHLSTEDQLAGLSEAERVIYSKGLLVLSVPFKEQVIQTICIHCKKTTPLFGHLHTLDVVKMRKLVPRNFKFGRADYLPSLQMVSCSKLFRRFPLSMWLLVNKLLGLFKRGYWMILQYQKE